MKRNTLQAVIMALCLGLAANAYADIKVLLLAYDNAEGLADVLSAGAGLEISQVSLDADPATPDMLEDQDVVVVWTNHEADFGDALGDVLADYVDQGGGVVEMVFGQFAPNHVIGGRWRGENYACVGTAERDTIFTSGSRGRRWLSQHPIIADIDTIAVDGRRTGDAPLLDGAERVLDYEDGQSLVAIRQDKPGRVVWLGFHPDSAILTGQWELLLVQGLAWAANMPSPEDNDGVPAAEDNCPTEPNPEQEDFDGDGLGDACDPDIDNDGLDNETEAELRTNLYARDTDGDGLEDADEVQRGTDPNVTDTDGDGLDDAAEVLVHRTDPTNPDTDGDGINDGAEVEAGLDPARLDTDGDGIGDGEEQAAGLDPLSPDSDGDDVSDSEERTYGTNPLDPDSDDGGVDDGDEVARGTNPLDQSDDYPASGNDGCSAGKGFLHISFPWERR